MAGDVQRVEPTALTSQATEMKGQNWHNPAEDAVAPPDALPSTSDAIANLNENAQSLKEFEELGRRSRTGVSPRCSRTRRRPTRRSTTPTARRSRIPNVTPRSRPSPIPDPQTPPPEIPSPAGTPRLLDASGYSNVPQTQADLTAGDNGTSLKTAMLQWGIASKRVENNKPKPPPGDWEGEAADAAYARMTTFGSWLTQLSEAWHDLAEAASKVVAGA